MALRYAPGLKLHKKLRMVESHKKKASLNVINLRIFLIPSLLMVIGGIIWSVVAIYSPTNFPLLLLGQIIFMIGMFVAIILGFWVMTLIRIPQR